MSNEDKGFYTPQDDAPVAIAPPDPDRPLNLTDDPSRVPNPGGMIIRPDMVRGSLPTASKRPDRFFYLLDLHRDLVFEIDGYKQPTANGERPGWMLILCCPICRNHLILDSMKKKLEVTSEGIESEEFRCSHPAQFGGVCPYAVALDRPGKSQRQVQVAGRWYKIDAVAKRA